MHSGMPSSCYIFWSPIPRIYPVVEKIRLSFGRSSSVAGGVRKLGLGVAGTRGVT